MSIVSYVPSNPDLTAGYVYQWTNQINGKKYIGSHNGRYKNYRASGYAIRAAFQKYGFENFTRQILYVGPNFLKVEAEILKSLNIMDSPNFYNMTNSTGNPMKGKSGSENPNFGRKHRPETIEKIRQASTGVEYSEETRAKIGAIVSARGARSEETRARIAAGLAKYHEKRRTVPGA